MKFTQKTSESKRINWNTNSFNRVRQYITKIIRIRTNNELDKRKQRIIIEELWSYIPI